MKIYIADQYHMKERALRARKEAREAGIEVTSHWMDEIDPPNIKMENQSYADMVRQASRDLVDIDAADAIVLFTIHPTIPFVRGGRHAEFGYAMGKGKTLIVVGSRENIFHQLPNVLVFSTWPEALAVIQKMNNPHPAGYNSLIDHSNHGYKE